MPVCQWTGVHSTVTVTRLPVKSCALLGLATSVGTMRSRLHEGWTVRRRRAACPTSRPPCPGCVHTDLLAAGLIPDPYLDDNETRLAWIGRTDWVYETTFDWHADGRRARRPGLRRPGHRRRRSTLNGVVVGRHRQHAPLLPVRRRRRCCAPGDNTCGSRSTRAVRVRRARSATRSATGPAPTTSRSTSSARWPATSAGTGARRSSPPASGGRSACTRGRPPGWPRSGHWSPWRRRRPGRGARRRRAAPPTSPADGDRLASAGVTAEAGSPAGADRAVVTLDRPGPALWWPRGYGDQPLLRPRRVAAAPTDVAWTAGAPDRASARSARHRRRRVHAFVSVNDVPVFVRGVNWIPDDCFPDRVTAASGCRPARPGRRRQRQPAAGLGRRPSTSPTTSTTSPTSSGSWSGRTSCSPAPPTPRRSRSPPRSRPRRASNVARLAAPEPGALERQQREHLGLARLGLAGAARRPHLGRRLLPRPAAARSSPSSTRPARTGRAARTPARRDRAPQRPDARHHAHLGRVELAPTTRTTATTRPRFVAEFGFQGPPAWRRCARPSPTTRSRPTRPACAHHQKAADGNGKLLRGLGRHFPAPATSTTGTTAPSSTRPGRSRSASSTSGRCAPLLHGHRSSGSSTTAGRSPRGRRSTATGAASRCGTRCGAPTPTAC